MDSTPLPPRKIVPPYASTAALIIAAAVPILFILVAVAFLMATNYNLLNWLE